MYVVEVHDPCCRGRRVCGTCARSDQRQKLEVDRLLRKHHGRAYDDEDWEQLGWDSTLPTGSPIGRRDG